MESDRFGLAALMLAGVTARVLGWRPDDFWAATPADVATVLAAWRDGGTVGAAAEGMGRADLAAMMEKCPDG